MKQLISMTLIPFAIFFLTACGNEGSNDHTEKSKIENPVKKSTPNAKCTSGGKCGTGKCSSSPKKMTP